jgi:hypothetical protein
MDNGRIAGKISILHIPSAVGNGLTPDAPPLASLVALTVNIYPRWSPNYPPPVSLPRPAALLTADPRARGGTRRLVSSPTAGRKPYGLASAARPGPTDSP